MADEFDVTEYPFVFFPVGLNLRGRHCVVIGNDREAREKAELLAEVGALVERIDDPAALDEARLHDAFFVISTPQDGPLSARLRALADRHRFLLTTIDQPQHGFVAMQAIAKAGPVRVAISTGGISPRTGATLRAALQKALDATFVRFIDCLNAQRERNRRALDDSEARRAAMRRAADGFEVDVQVSYPEWFEQRTPLDPEVLPG
jgi:precorrin-2 dehydrogenase/sirohydrochlorin ferrochelatase